MLSDFAIGVVVFVKAAAIPMLLLFLSFPHVVLLWIWHMDLALSFVGSRPLSQFLCCDTVPDLPAHLSRWLQ